MKRPFKQPKPEDINAFRQMSQTYYQPDKNSKTGDKLQPRRPRSRWKVLRRTLMGLLLAIFCLLLIFAGWNYRNFAAASDQLFGTRKVWGALSTTPLEKTTAGRTNILLIGYSVDRDNHGGADLTDSILILSLDHESDNGNILSIPRDLYVTIPGSGPARINEAFQRGEQMEFSEPGFSSGGVGLLQKTIKTHLDIDTHYWALINYAAVEGVVDALGGVTVTIDSPDPRGLYDPNFQPFEGGPLRLSNGQQQIDGQTALRLTRARDSTGRGYGFPSSDFSRTKNQQHVVTAIRQELSLGAIIDPRTNSQLLMAGANNIVTNVKLSEALPLARLISKVPADQLQPVSLQDPAGISKLTDLTTTAGARVLIPAAGIDNFSEIQAELIRLGF